MIDTYVYIFLELSDHFFFFKSVNELKIFNLTKMF